MRALEGQARGSGPHCSSPWRRAPHHRKDIPPQGEQGGRRGPLPQNGQCREPVLHCSSPWRRGPHPRMDHAESQDSTAAVHGGEDPTTGWTSYHRESKVEGEDLHHRMDNAERSTPLQQSMEERTSPQEGHPTTGKARWRERTPHQPQTEKGLCLKNDKPEGGNISIPSAHGGEDPTLGRTFHRGTGS